MNAEQAREIVERRRNGMEMMRDADQIILARGYLAALEGLEVKALVEALEKSDFLLRTLLDDGWKGGRLTLDRNVEALAAFRKAVNP